MAQARGINFIGTVHRESSYGVPLSTGQRFYARSFGLQSTQNLIDSEILSGRRSRVRPSRGNIDVAGDIVTEPHAESLVGLFEAALGAVDVDGSGPYEHTLTIGDLPSLTFEKDHGPQISGVGRYERFFGCKIGTLGLDFPVEGYPTINFGVRGQDSDLFSSPLDATPIDRDCLPFTVFDMSVLDEGGSAIAYVESCSINLDNGLDDSIFALRGGGKRRDLPDGFASISGQIVALFESPVLLEKAIDGTESSLKVTLSRGDGLGSSGNESMEFLVQQLLFERAGVPVDGPAGLRLTLPYRAYRTGDDNGLQIKIFNAFDDSGS
jgi:hypothetical protein